MPRFSTSPKGIPSHDTFGRVFAVINPTALQEAFRRWVNSLVEVTCGEVVAIDGKALRRSFQDSGNKAFVHMVSAWATSNGAVLGQLKTDTKSSEITAVPRLIELLQLKGAVVTMDAAGCHKEIATKIVDSGADYVLAVKDNQPTRRADIETSFVAATEREDFDSIVGFAETTEKGHGRTETRRCMVCRDLSNISQRAKWTNLGCLILIDAERTVNGETSTERRLSISSNQRLSAKDALATVRRHWGIENGLHWVLDLAFREDDCRVRAGTRPTISRCSGTSPSVYSRRPSPKGESRFGASRPGGTMHSCFRSSSAAALSSASVPIVDQVLLASRCDGADTMKRNPPQRQRP